LTSGTAYTFQVRASNATGNSAYSAASNSVTPAVPSSFESIATATGTGSSGTITFSSIPGTYKALQIRALTKGTATTGPTYNMSMRFNSDTTDTNYVNHYLRGNGTTASAGQFGSSTDGFVIGYTTVSRTSAPDLTNIFGTNLIDIIDYASTSKYKTARSFFGADLNDTSGSGIVGLQSGLWMSTAAISSITLTIGASFWTTTSTFALYGIK
jgi:hypothetical protein